MQLTTYVPAYPPTHTAFMLSVTQREQKEKSLVYNEPTVIIQVKKLGKAIPVTIRGGP
jgi:hypothetical protein